LPHKTKITSPTTWVIAPTTYLTVTAREVVYGEKTVKVLQEELGESNLPSHCMDNIGSGFNGGIGFLPIPAAG
jgi:hypothetical protein